MDYRKSKYQYKYSEMHHEEMYNHKGRERKAKTMVSVLQDYIKTDLKTLTLLDVGSSTGLIVNHLAMYFGVVVGIDIDRTAVEFASSTHKIITWSFFKLRIPLDSGRRFRAKPATHSGRFRPPFILNFSS